MILSIIKLTNLNLSLFVDSRLLSYYMCNFLNVKTPIHTHPEDHLIVNEYSSINEKNITERLTISVTDILFEYQTCHISMYFIHKGMFLGS